MAQIEATFRGGVFQPEGDVHLQENQRVRLSVEPIGPGDVASWLEDVKRLHRQILDRRGPFPDSTPEISEDRNRDV
jgi:predicted DNA-binding antitoxin AbrB/MazE fold protein